MSQGVLSQILAQSEHFILNNIKDIYESDFNSCVESEDSYSSSGEGDDNLKENQGFKTVNDKKCEKIRRKKSLL
jgi:hypothetical protein